MNGDSNAARDAGTWERYRDLAIACEYLHLVGATLVVEKGWFAVETLTGWQTAETTDQLLVLAFSLVAEHPQHGLGLGLYAEVAR